MVRTLFVLVLSLLVSSCGSSSPSSASETPRVSGAWIGNSTLTSVSGGECVGSTLASAIGSRDVFSARIQQTDTDLAASLTYEGNRTSCVYRGSAINQSISLNMASCPDGQIETFVCSNGDVRRLEIADSRVSVQNDNRTGRGTDTTTLNVYSAGSTIPLSTLTVTSQFLWNILGIPHNDFHIFDGSILPGYVDGTVIIPEESTPFCTKCGWF